MIKLVALLGNYGAQYANNRHNVAWRIGDSFDFAAELRWKRQFNGVWAQLDKEGGRFYFLKPETYMNLSGESLAPLMKFFKLATEEILVVHDELELPFGTCGFKQGGGLGGHNGLRSIKASLGTQDFLRFRFGIGRPSHDNIADYVLSDFSSEEERSIEVALRRAADAIALCLFSGAEAALSEYAKRSLL